MTPQPQPLPGRIFGRLRLVPREPDLLALPDKRTPALDPERPSVQGFEPLRFVDAFLRHHDTDAHAAPYLTDSETPDGLQRRRKLGDLEDVVTSTAWLDIDTERHEWAAEQRADSAAVSAALESEREAIEAAFAAGFPRPRVLYPTRGGWRLVYVLAEPIPTAELRPWIRGLIYLAELHGLGVDAKCKDPTRLMRLPNVVRDGVGTWTEPYMAEGVEFLPVQPLDIRSEVDPIEDDAPAAQVAAVSDAEAVAYRDSLTEAEKDRCDSYARAAFERIVAGVAAAEEGDRNQKLYNGACDLFEFANAGVESFDLDEVSEALTAAGAEAGLPADEVANTIHSAAGKVRSKGYDFGGIVQKGRKDADYFERWRENNGKTKPAHGQPDTKPDTAQESGPEAEDDELPGCPLELFPPVLGNFVRSVARTVQIAPDFPAMFALATVAAAMSHRVGKIKVGFTHDEAPALWVVACLSSGERKSSAVGLVTGPLLELERLHLAKHAAAARHYVSRKDVHDAQLKKLKDEAAKEGNAGDNSGTMARLEALEARPPVPPTSPGLTTSDATPEAIKTMMANQNGRVFFCSSEGGIFDRLADNKQRNVDLEPLLKAHAGESIKENRRGSGQGTKIGVEIVIPKAVLGLAVSLQPFVIESMLANRRFKGTGLLARMLLAFPESLAGRRTLSPQALDADAVAAYTASLAKLYDGRTSADIVLRIDGEAWAAWNDFALANERRLAPGQDLASDETKDWASKLPGAVARIAAVFHVVEHGLGVPAIGVDAVRAAAEFATRYLIPHALHAFTSAEQTNPGFERNAREVIEQFLHDATDPAPESEVAIADLTTAFDAWRAEQPEHGPITETVFRRALTKLGFPPSKNTKGDRVRKGLALRT